ncbi:MAG TPA: anthranilate phosphoribosyltransferase [Acidimicrobiales bacterium]|nr:anthranilate phosphoribosyltransferase [Acidimicrobiales bacterium]
MESFAIDVLNPLVRGESLERDAASGALREILDGRVDGVLIASFLTAITIKGETVEEMTGFVDAMIACATTFSLDVEAIDIVGTGGDQLHSVNVSTMAAFVVAGCGVPVAKHGNRAASSSVGSADLLEALGVRIDAPVDVVRACVRGAGFGFMFAPVFHTALANLAPVRRSLQFRTIFNALGPLANPALVRRSLIGVASTPLADKMAEVLYRRGIDHAVLVSADDGLDELSLGSPSTLEIVTREGRTRERVDAGTEVGIHHRVADLRGGDVAQNVAVTRMFLAGERGPVFDTVCANAALALLVAGRASSLRDGFDAASAAVLDGRAGEVLERLVTISNS